MGHEHRLIGGGWVGWAELVYGLYTLDGLRCQKTVSILCADVQHIPFKVVSLYGHCENKSKQK